ATQTIPIVMVGVAEPVTQGLVASLARPGGNITGVSTLGAGVVVKQLDLIREATPGTRRIAALMNPDLSHHAGGLDGIRAASQAMSIEIVPVTKRVAADIEPAVETMAALGGAAVIVFEDSVVRANRTALIGLLQAKRLPAIFTWRFYVADGALMSFAPALTGLWRKGGDYTGRILAGGQPATMPVEQPTIFELAINLRTPRSRRPAIS